MNDMITMPRAEYDRLVEIAEDAADIVAIEEFKTKLARGEEEFVPAEFVNRMLDGESLLKLWREHRGLSQNELAKLSGVNRIQIGDIEDRGKTGSVATLKKLADALDLQIDDLVS
ncbi:helix-turn-helix domain-containing protein [Pseudaestuariivita rosea]|uniref:helix-turn-helix domain-containing protein n=1 Tax=Pseudaestuariivita rosea TaxID=2763263 RepID=UPI001ABA8E76|nr:helix-turn-helix transcriptional regulator [Pseudaestuariivita rosea]